MQEESPEEGDVCCEPNQVLATAEANAELVRVDPLQRLHTLCNLAQLLAGGVPSGVPRTLRDDRLEADAEAIRQVRP
jgi:hypothetical protein